MQGWEFWFVTLLAGVVGGFATYLYGEYRARPVVKIHVERCERAKQPIRLPSPVYDTAFRLGTFQTWLASKVKWKVEEHFNENRFTLQHLRDVLNLCPRFISLQNVNWNRYKTMKQALESTSTESQDQFTQTLAQLRHYWLEVFKEDIFVTYGNDSKRVLTQLTANLDGDIAQSQHMVNGVKALEEFLRIGFDPASPSHERIQAQYEEMDTPSKPRILIHVFVVNIGRSSTLLKDTARLQIGNDVFSLRGLGPQETFEIYEGRYFKVESMDVQPICFTQDPDKTTLERLKTMKGHLIDGRKQARIYLEDMTGRNYKTARFAFVDSE